MPPKKSQKQSKSKITIPHIKVQEASINATASTHLPLDYQQRILNIFRNAFPDAFGQDLDARLQAVKSALFRRNFATAFGCDANLSAYAVRWSPSRALAYTHIFKDILPAIAHNRSLAGLESEKDADILRMTCLGGGAGAELVAAGAMLGCYAEFTAENTSTVERLHMRALDVASWADVLQTLHKSLVNPPPLSKFASAHVLANNKAMTEPSASTYAFEHRDALNLTPGKELMDLFGDADVVTAFFTMNELFSTSIAKTNSLLLHLKSSMQPGSYLLVVDSAGSYATVTLNGGEKTYPMHWLLDHTMLSSNVANKGAEDAGETTDNDTLWIKLRTEESTWFRIPEGLKYPLELENMRYQLHLYRKNGSAG